MSEHEHTHRVRSYEVDHQGFLFNGRYLEIADAAMAEYFRAGGFSYPQMLALGFDPAVVDMAATFSRPGKLDDLLRVGVACVRVGTSSFALIDHLSCAGETISRIQVTYVNVDQVTGRAAPLPTAIRAYLVGSLTPQEAP